MFLLSLACSLFGHIHINLATLLTLEQTLFVALSAILLVFHESIISYSALSSLFDKLSKLRKEDMQLKVFSYIDSKSSEKEYKDYLSQLESNISYYKSLVQEYKRASYLIYALFTLIGVFIVLFSLMFALEKHFLLSLFLYMQIFLFLLWIVSAFHSERQKQKVLQSLKTNQIAKDIKEYIKKNEEKSIENSLEFE